MLCIRGIRVDVCFCWASDSGSSNHQRCLLCQTEGIILFEEFLKTEYSDENILFWKACERYSKLPKERLQAEADKIYQEFLCEKSPKLVSESCQ